MQRNWEANGLPLHRGAFKRRKAVAATVSAELLLLFSRKSSSLRYFPESNREEKKGMTVEIAKEDTRLECDGWGIL